MKLTQKELSGYYNEGQTVILAYRQAFEIKFSHGANQYIMQQFYKEYGDLPLTKRGRYMAFSPESANRIIY